MGQTLAVIAAAALLATIISDVFARHASLESLTVPLVLLAVAITVRASMIWAGEGIGHRTAAALIASLRLRRLRELLARGPFGLARERTGELATLLTAGLDSLDAYFARFVPQLLVAVAAPVLIVAFVAAIDWVSALILAVTLPLIPLFATLIGRAAQRHTQHRAESLQMLGGSFLDTLQGLPTLRVFGRGAAQAGRLRDTSARLRRTVMATLRIAFLSAFVLELLASLGTALLAVSIALRLVGGDLSLRGGLTVLVLAPEAYLPLRALAASFHTSLDGSSIAPPYPALIDNLTQTQSN